MSLTIVSNWCHWLCTLWDRCKEHTRKYSAFARMSERVNTELRKICPVWRPLTTAQRRRMWWGKLRRAEELGHNYKISGLQNFVFSLPFKGTWSWLQTGLWCCCVFPFHSDVIYFDGCWCAVIVVITDDCETYDDSCFCLFFNFTHE